MLKKSWKIRKSKIDWKESLRSFRLPLHFLTRYSKQYFIWYGVAYLAAALVLLQLSGLFFSGSELKKQAIDDGQRAVLHLATGEEEGNIRHTAKKTAESDDASAQIVGGEGLAPAPFANLIERSDKGMIPVMARDGTSSWRYYARPYNNKSKKPVISIIFTNVGLSKTMALEALQLPHTVTLSFSPYVSDAKSWARKARELGFESLIDLPMQEEDFPATDPGPYGLLEEMGANETSARLHWTLSRYPGFVGVLAPAREKMTNNISTLRFALNELTARGVMFVYVKRSGNANFADVARSQSLLTVGADLVIDEEVTPAAINTQLAQLVELSKKQGYAIGIAHAFPPTLQAVSTWVDSIGSQGIDVVPLSAVAQMVHQ